MDQIRWHKIEGIIDEALTYDSLENQQKFIKKSADDAILNEVLTLVKAIHQADKKQFLITDKKES